MFFQDAGSALFPWQTVEQNVRCGLKLQKVRGPEQDRRVATMRHEGDLSCNLKQRLFRIDRSTGYGEAVYEA